MRPARAVTLLGAFLAAVAVVLESPWFWWLGLCLLSTAVLGAAYAWVAGRGMIVQFELGSHGTASPTGSLPTDWWPSAQRAQPVFEGDLLIIKFHWRTNSPLSGAVRLTGDVSRDPVVVSLPAPTKRMSSRSFRLGSARRGVVTTADWRLTVQDPLGLASVNRPLEGRHLAVVYPAFASLRTYSDQAEAFSPTMSTFQDDIEIRGVREWREGDQRRHIHWPATAKRGQLMVKEREYIRQPAVGIFLDGRPSNLEVADQIARIAASEAFEALADGGDVALWWPGAAYHRPGELSTLWDVLEVLARYPLGDPSDDLPHGLIAAVAVVESEGPALMAVEDVRRRAGNARVWHVGEGELATDTPVNRVGTRWPL